MTRGGKRLRKIALFARLGGPPKPKASIARQHVETRASLPRVRRA